ncbi:hypothetical protein BT69DRAFT_1354477 [Atractiella rhizophila]|nr:hypothetical protein BT69DRAFT_1354477 [Atractiella rhizophila]
MAHTENSRNVCLRRAVLNTAALSFLCSSLRSKKIEFLGQQAYVETLLDLPFGSPGRARVTEELVELRRAKKEFEFAKDRKEGFCVLVQRWAAVRADKERRAKEERTRRAIARSIALEEARLEAEWERSLR